MNLEDIVLSEISQKQKANIARHYTHKIIKEADIKYSYYTHTHTHTHKQLSVDRHVYSIAGIIIQVTSGAGAVAQ